MTEILMTGAGLKEHIEEFRNRADSCKIASVGMPAETEAQAGDSPLDHFEKQ